MSKIHNISEKEAWNDQIHAKVYDYMSTAPNFILKKYYESFGEGKLLKKWKPHNGRDRLFEVGCATGELSATFTITVVILIIRVSIYLSQLLNVQNRNIQMGISTSWLVV